MPDLTLDNWAALSHKAVISEPTLYHYGPQTWNWTGKDHQRRLNAYMVLEAYRKNVARWFVQASSQEARDMRREYGDPDLLIAQVTAAVLGRGYHIAVEGADDGGEEANAAAVARHDELEAWSEDVQMELKLQEIEKNALALGDSVVWLTYSSRRKRVLVHVIDPGFYFPVYKADEDGEDYPSRIHLAWQYEDWVERTQRYEMFVRRITFELEDSEPYSVAYQSEPAEQRCFLTDATWTLDDLDWDLRQAGPDDFKPQKATFRTNEDGEELNRLDLGLDFIPVVHIPNVSGHPWGQSIFTNISHIIDDLQMADTDAAEAADVAGGPPIVIVGADGSGLDLYGPKTVVTVPIGGQASVLDTSKGLDSLEDHVDRIHKRMTVNSRIPREILGIVGAGEVPSGTALELGFHPFKQLITEIRLSRKFKYRLVFKMVQRMMVAHGRWTGEVRKAEIEFGAALPEDTGQTINMVKELAAADRPIISRLTALSMLADVGLPIKHPSDELDLVHGEDFDAARLIQMATESTELAAEHLGIEIPEETREERVAREQMEAQTEADVAAAKEQAATVSKTTPSSGAGTGTREPGATRSNSRNGRRRRDN